MRVFEVKKSDVREMLMSVTYATEEACMSNSSTRNAVPTVQVNGKPIKEPMFAYFTTPKFYYPHVLTTTCYNDLAKLSPPKAHKLFEKQVSEMY